MRIFLIAGKSGSGKGEVAKLIKEYYIYKMETCAITGYSKPVKQFAMELTDWDGNNNTKPRGYLQELGDTIRSVDEKFLVNNMLSNLRVYEKLADNVVISDVRFPVEIDDIKLNYDNVYAIYVENQFSASYLTVEEQSHKTETALENYDDFDYILANDTMESLKDKVFKYLEGIE
jgi:dephospho-CoA kinase